MLAAEVHSLVLAFDQVYILEDRPEEIIGTKLEIDPYVDSKKLFDVIYEDRGSCEKRLQIDIYTLKESNAKV